MKEIKKIIQSTGFCSQDEIVDLSVMKTGMTNRSYSFYVKGQRYIIRIPGEGTDLLINRQQEFDVYTSIKPLDIGERTLYFDPTTGIKIAAFLEDARPCDALNPQEVCACMQKLRSFHDKRLTVSHDFDIWGQLEYYESLLDGQPSCYSDYLQTKKDILELRNFIENQPKERILCHIDSVPDNFMFLKKADDTFDIRLIDWEYAGMQDPHVDIAMFAVYSMYDRKQVDTLINLYFTEGCSHQVRMKIYCYIAVSGLLWSNWCEFKRKCGVEFGAYALRQYEYAKEYAAYFRDEYRKEYGNEYS
jgi:thiamine kinase-like enzyme